MVLAWAKTDRSRVDVRRAAVNGPGKCDSTGDIATR